ncbi:MAG: squalene synthase HpnC [Alphaproteobacteria bacterium]|nr:squalene synthase HpnC [Alphaproteobacteria bacterium]
MEGTRAGRRGAGAVSAVETPSGKGAADENFPVGSWLLPAPLRPHIAAFYRFARAIDDIADNPALSPADKLARLDRMALAVASGSGDATLATADRLRRSLAATGVTPRHALDLVDAFRQDAVKSRYAGWDDLMSYCDRSAAPVGRYLLDLHGEDRRLYPGSDALCNALQVINHLQDCGDDRRALDRVYLPVPWLAEAGASVEDLDAPALSPGLRRVLDRCLDGVERLLAVSHSLAPAMASTRLALETGVIQRIATTLVRRLRAEDPLAHRVALGRTVFAAAALAGGIGTVMGRWTGAGAAARRRYAP